MPWARVDDGFWCHPKVLGLDLDARGLWVSALSWSCHHKTDFVPFHIVRICGDDGTAAKKLVDAGLWEESGEGWLIHDWQKYQSESAKKAEAGRKGGIASGEARRAKAAEAENEAHESGSHEAQEAASTEAGPSHPIPTRPEPPSSSTDDGFDEFWSLYPPRAGRKVGKAKAKDKWRRLSTAQRETAMRATRSYAAAVNADKTIAKDPERFLTNRYFEDWAETEAPAQRRDAVMARNERRRAGEACEHCDDSGWIERGTDVTRCACPAGRAA